LDTSARGTREIAASAKLPLCLHSGTTRMSPELHVE
jgi:hypothetical protein